MKRSLSSLTVVILASTFVLTGCGEQPSDRTNVYSVHGTVTSKGKPAPGVQLILHPSTNITSTDGKLFPNGVTDEAGRYELTTYAKNDGAPPGDWIVTVSWPDDRVTPQVRDEILSSGESLPDRYRGRFSKSAGSKWRVSVTAGDNEVPPINIP